MRRAEYDARIGKAQAVMALHGDTADLVPGSNNDFTDGRTSTRMLKIPNTVPKGMNKHAMQAATRQKV